MNDSDQTYGVGAIKDLKPVEAPKLPYQPQNPKSYNPKIGVIGCGGITEHHLTAYKNAGYEVAALCDIVESKAEERRQQFYPNAKVYKNYQDLLQQDGLEVIDITTHAEERVQIMEAAIEARKHVLSQKPFVLDLDAGERLVALADSRNVKLAVNQNGRWAPHFSYMRHAVREGLIGKVLSVRFSVDWDHSWITGTEFENVRHLVLYDFGIHWFDMAISLVGERAMKQVFASIQRSATQRPKPALLGQAVIDFEGAQSSIVLNGDTKYGPQDRTYVTGTEGTLLSLGPDLMQQQVTLFNEQGYGSPHLEGAWFPTGMHGAMAELLCAIEENREPVHSGKNNLATLGLSFAACASADDSQPKIPGEVRQMRV